MDIQKLLERNHYVATAAQVETLAANHYTHDAGLVSTSGTYLRVLVAAVQAQIGSGKRGKPDQLAVIERVDAMLYPAVLRGIVTPDCAPANGTPLDAAEATRRSLERNRRASFARSAKSTLVAFTRAGGDIRRLDVHTVSKGQLRKATAPAESQNPLERRIDRAHGVIERSIVAMARGDPHAARDALSKLMDDLRKVLERLGPDEDEAGTTTVVTARRHARTVAGRPTMVHHAG